MRMQCKPPKEWQTSECARNLARVVREETERNPKKIKTKLNKSRALNANQ